MKITNLGFQKYNQFENLTIDLTYPAGHPKAGQPLDKVCLIGQNGTGKTTILEVVEDFVYFRRYGKSLKYNTIECFNNNVDLFEFKDENKQWNLGYKTQNNANLLSLKADILANVQFLIKEKKEKDFVGIDQSKSSTTFKGFSFIEIGNQTKSEIWQSFFTEFEAFDTKILAKTKELLNAATTKNGEKLLQDFIKWKAKEQNPRQFLAEKLNVFLNRFGLEMDIDNTDFYIGLRAINAGVQLQPNILSTGILQIILSAMPIFALRNKVEIVLIDEPERSLYPDTQRDITDFYTSLSPESQFFFATHSPIIASSFDPWEIVELYFDENHKVQQRLYYNGERHVDNYKIHPKYMRWDSIFIKMFGIDVEGNPERDKQLEKLSAITQKMEDLKATEGKGTPAMQALWLEYSKLAAQLDWRIDN